MPFYPRQAQQFIDEYLKYLQLHSTLDMLRGMYLMTSGLFKCPRRFTYILTRIDAAEPPSEYASPAIDLVGELTQIRRKVGQGVYDNQFDFDRSIQNTILQGYDGHLRIDLCSQSIMIFEHDNPLVSVSEDGLQLPKIYTWCKSKIFNAITKMIAL